MWAEIWAAAIVLSWTVLYNCCIDVSQGDEHSWVACVWCTCAGYLVCKLKRSILLQENTWYKDVTSTYCVWCACSSYLACSLKQSNILHLPTLAYMCGELLPHPRTWSHHSRCQLSDLMLCERLQLKFGHAEICYANCFEHAAAPPTQKGGTRTLSKRSLMHAIVVLKLSASQ
jgi:hypothetical protein